MNTITGVIPVAPTVFTDDEELDLEGQRRVIDFLVDANSDGVCILANYSEQFSLTDDERDQVLTATLDHAAGRIPVCVTTSHYSARIARERTQRAQREGAAMVMLMAPFFGATVKADEDAVVEYFKRVTDGLEIDVMIQDAPMSPTPLSVALLARLAAEIPQIRYAKIEMPQTADKIRALVSAAGENLPGVFDGEEAITLIPDLEAGAQGTMSSCLVPDQLGPIVHDYHAGHRDSAVARWEDLLPLIHFENRQCGLRATKTLMKEGRIIHSDRTRAPLGELHPDTRSQLLEIAKRKDPLILRWA
ncbi:Dihydrodipicolinate synthetase family [Sinomonas atrocyanea]|uniref:Dihydrodipicolinate synthetase family n=1 Tax=Sinomonas atrocyanea TaxID=37927 RepID=A0A126ZXM5_9MICC|nr:dihydrodipicolinate synthase family protein [Sinomonas atrocyanea]AMM31636.1 Dihydrodipicolinate synthetase family [Sinomonas atrocyanea]GEB64211.1 dihydrodipicolinate synthase family protein [Sinomonas atrocyanea]GGG57263.1 dihydrodipicolinate synthase family protein [Sinomonas atrocyanea]